MVPYGDGFGRKWVRSGREVPHTDIECPRTYSTLGTPSRDVSLSLRGILWRGIRQSSLFEVPIETVFEWLESTRPGPDLRSPNHNASRRRDVCKHVFSQRLGMDRPWLYHSSLLHVRQKSGDYVSGESDVIESGSEERGVAKRRCREFSS